LLLYGAGLRISEALSLELTNVDLTAAILTIRESKFYKTRLAPMSPARTGAFGTTWPGVRRSTQLSCGTLLDPHGSPSGAPHHRKRLQPVVVYAQTYCATMAAATSRDFTTALREASQRFERYAREGGRE